MELAKLRKTNGHRDSLAASGLGRRVRVEQRKAEDAASHPQKRPVSFTYLFVGVVVYSNVPESCFCLSCLS